MPKIAIKHNLSVMIICEVRFVLRPRSSWSPARHRDTVDGATAITFVVIWIPGFAATMTVFVFASHTIARRDPGVGVPESMAV